ncbi:MAG: Flp family type IVb pilin [Candidatus Hydrogenedentes bacterium]|nr:Flp family type IVb pilin [Candidatus Hydrogenedentota bacterium]
MLKFLTAATRFVKANDGPTATEYAVMLSLIIIACIATISLLGAEVNTIFSNVQTAIQAQ